MKFVDTSQAKSFVLAAFLGGATLLLYARTWSYGFSYLDDKQLILDQAAWLSDIGNWFDPFRRTYLGSSSDTYYRPIVNLTFMLDAVADGMMPARYHATNTLLHAVNCLLLLRLLVALGFGRLAALAGVGVFAIHPVQVGSVAWIPGRNDLLLGGFALLSLLSLLRAGQRGELWAKSAHLGCFALALFTKETAVVLPILFGLVAAGSGAGSGQLRDRWLWVGWIAVLVGYLVARTQVVEMPAGYAAERWRVVVAHYPLLLSDLGKLVLPWKLTVLGDPQHTSVWPGAMAVLLAVGAVTLVRGCRIRLLALGGALALTPLLASLPGTRFVLLDNRLYLPMVGMALLIAEVTRALLGRTRVVARGVVVALVLLSVSCVRATVAHTEKYRSREAFAEAAMLGTPQSPIAIHLRFRQAYARELETP